MRILNNCEHNRKEEEEFRHREYDVGKIAGAEMERKNTEKNVTKLTQRSGAPTLQSRRFLA